MLWLLGLPLYLSRAVYRLLIRALIACTGLHGLVGDVARRICGKLLERVLRDREVD
jgi:hypothetical protein